MGDSAVTTASRRGLRIGVCSADSCACPGSSSKVSSMGLGSKLEQVGELLLTCSVGRGPGVDGMLLRMGLKLVPEMMLSASSDTKSAIVARVFRVLGGIVRGVRYGDKVRCVVFRAWKVGKCTGSCPVCRPLWTICRHGSLSSSALCCIELHLRCGIAKWLLHGTWREPVSPIG